VSLSKALNSQQSPKSGMYR